MKKKISAYQFEKISSRMARDFGTIGKNLEEEYESILLPMELNLIKVNRKCRLDNGRRTIEAIQICLFMIDGYLSQTEYDLDYFISEGNKPYLEALLISFDPFTNDFLRSFVEEESDLNSMEGLRAYFTDPVKCLLRIKKSIELWSSDHGNAGYFKFLEGLLGRSVPNDDKMSCIADFSEDDSADMP